VNYGCKKFYKIWPGWPLVWKVRSKSNYHNFITYDSFEMRESYFEGNSMHSHWKKQDAERRASEKERGERVREREKERERERERVRKPISLINMRGRG
jgi:hypothetical protein